MKAFGIPTILVSGSAVAQFGAPVMTAYVLRKNALPFTIVRGVLQAILACNADWHDKRWAVQGRQVEDISKLLGISEQSTSATLNAIKIPTEAELDIWFSGKMATMLEDTERFL